MFPHDTAMGFWICPECKAQNDLIVVKNLEMPDQLNCDYCDLDRRAFRVPPAG